MSRTSSVGKVDARGWMTLNQEVPSSWSNLRKKSAPAVGQDSLPKCCP